MLVFHQKVFSGGISGTAAVYSLPQFNAQLGQAVRWYVLARVTNVTGTSPTITVELQHSSTGMESEFKDLNTAAVAPISALAVTANVINLIEGSMRHTDANVSVPAAYVRAEIKLGGTSPNANVEIWITGRSDN